MTRARILADYVSSGDELALKAPLASPALVTPNLGTPSAGVMTNMTGAVTASLVDDAVTLDKMAHGADGSLITYSASTVPELVPPGTTGHVLTSRGDASTPTFQALAASGLTTFTGYISFAHNLTGDVDQALSFTPTAVIFFGSAPFDSQSMSWGFCDQNNNNWVTLIKTVDDAIAIEYETHSIWLQGGGGSYSRATCTLGTDKFTLNWSKDGTNAAGTGYVMYMAMK